ncbi:membrane alanyl aminopeptidase [Anopheles bellator]|uniref:membrane alanyl aminopeptidase n=1 Tax=Anopheles bellator TaxID=139047 RepID=UPI00264853F5|nr:membrane alanyl aminopeptidase [Anopheles bellator]XP_058061220.1 membrane alanyl aminopeptidase [Anopheles bellator]
MGLMRKLTLGGFIAVACCLISSSVRGSPVDPDERYRLVEAEPRAALEDYRLNEDVWPSHYDVEIKPYLEAEDGKAAFTFDGKTTITVSTVLSTVTAIKLHMARMNIATWRVNRKSDNTLVQTSTEIYDGETEILTLPLQSPLLANVDYLLYFEYTGTMDDDMHGFYRTYYLVDGNPVWMGSTQFEQTHARRAFPCFDEPRYKAKFQLTISHKTPQYSVYSNTPVAATTADGTGRTLSTFAVTPPMSTYLLAFMVAPYEVTAREEMGILARPQARDQTAYSLDVGLKLLRALGTWIDYPFTSVAEMTRMYMAAVPDFSAGAMENWGLLTYRETNILYRADDATSLQQQRIAAVISHEIAHQWFGDLVTCEWWDVTWLNEGFARYFQYFGTETVETTWELGHQFVVEQLQGVMQMDSLASTHPMTHPVYTPAQASAIFDNISYNKGAVILRMMEHFLTPTRFQTALRQYIKNQAYGTARPEHLFAVLDQFEATAQDRMKPWTVQSGYPLLTVTSSANGFTVTQKRFLVNEPSHTDATLWPVPITYATKESDFSNTMPTFYGGATFNLDVPDAANVQYFILNNQQVGYYRVNYDATLWAKIKSALRSTNFGGIHVLNRAQIVDDLFNLARGGIVPYGTALDILEYLKDETEYAPWLAAVNGLTTLARRIHEEDEELFMIHILDILEKVYDVVKFQSPTSNERRVLTYLRQNVLQWACNYGHEACSEAAVTEFTRFFLHPETKVHPDMRQVVYCEGIRKGTKAHFEFLWNQYLTTNVATEQILVLQGLGCASTSETIFILMEAITSDHIRKQDKSNAYTYIINNPYTLTHVSAYLRQNHAIWAASHGDYMNVASAFNNLLARLKNDDERQTISTFIETNKNVLGTAAYDSIKGGLDDYDSNKRFTADNRDAIREFLKQKAGGGAATILTNVTLLVGLLMLVLFRL